jgi:putative sigma-54 modulation protein
MDIQITGKNLEVLPKVRDYIIKKLGKVDKYLDKIMAFEVVISEEKTKSAEQHFVVQVTINNKGTLLRAEERGPNARTTIDRVTETLTRQIEHYKGTRPYANKRKSPSIRTNTVEIPDANEPDGDESEEEPKIVKTKRFDVKPMSMQDAIQQMELLGHDFFLYNDSDDNNRFNLVYRRKDGNYGLIETTNR